MRSQRAGPKDGADGRAEEVKVCSLVRGCQAGRRARDGDTGGPSADMGKQACNRSVSLPSIFPLLNQDKGFSGVGKETEEKQYGRMFR